MEIVITPSPLILIVALAALLVGVSSILLKRWARWRKILGAAILVVACGAVLFFFYRERHLVVGQGG
jgi:drug/metabolite transporter (DMT)-like permease